MMTPTPEVLTCALRISRGCECSAENDAYRYCSCLSCRSLISNICMFSFSFPLSRTEQLLAVANICCDGRVVSVLEGGYGELRMKDGKWDYEREPLAANAAAHVRALAGKRK